MDPQAIATRLAAQPGRAAGRDGERRAAVWLRDRLRAAGREAHLQTVWVRPSWPLVHALHCAVAAGAGLLSVWEPAAGFAVLVLTLVSLVGDLTGRLYLARRLTPRRATQNVIAGARAGRRAPPPGARDAPIRLIVAANLDAGRTGAAYGGWSRLEARLRRGLGGHLPSPLGLLVGAVLVLAGVAVARQQGAGGPGLGAVQFVPTVLLLVAFAALIDIALSEPSPGAGVHASAAAVALALVDELDRHPPRHLEVELVLAGAGEGPVLGMQAYVASQRRLRAAEETVVLAVEPCGAGTPRWLTRDGQVFPLRYHPRLLALCAELAGREADLGARPYASHGTSAAYAARVVRWPAVAVGARDEEGRVPRARTPEDTAEALDPLALGATLELALALVARLDEDLGR